MADLVLFPDKRLRQHAERVTTFGPLFDALVRQLVETMDAEQAAGIAAPQIGSRQAVFVIARRPLEPLVYVNPKITWRSEKITSYVEGCLSFPGKQALVVRPEIIDFEAADATGAIRKDRLDGWYARVFQHEFDHLAGKLFIDLLPPLAKREVTGARKG